MIDLKEDDIIFQAEPHIYTVKGKRVPSVTQIIEAAGFGEDFFMVPPNVLRLAQERGRAVHMACAYLNDGDLDIGSVDDRIWGYVQAYQAFCNKALIKTVATEKRMAVLNIDRIGGLAGTVDWVCFLKGGRRAIIDLKTGQNSSAGLQTAGYQMLWEAGHPKEPIYERYSLKLNRDGTYKLRPEEKLTDAPAFLDALDYYHAKAAKDQWRGEYGHQ